MNMFWKRNQVEFNIGDVVKFKKGQTHGYMPNLEISDWYGRVIEVDKKSIELELDSITLRSIPEDLIEVYEEREEYVHILTIPKRDLELAEARDTQDDVIQAQDDLIERLDIATGIPNYNIEYNRWVRHFQASERFRALDKIDREKSDFVLEIFRDYMKDYEGKIPAKWNINSVRNVLTKWIPRKVTGEQRLFEAFGIVILEFFKFLDEKGYRKMTSLIPVAIKAKNKIVEESQKREHWGSAKTFMMEALESGVEMDNQKAVNRFMRKKQFQALTQLRNMKDEPESKPRITSRAVNTKQFKNIWQNQKITVQYPDGTIKENIKFKEVKNDLYEGLCQLIKK